MRDLVEEAKQRAAEIVAGVRPDAQQRELARMMHDKVGMVFTTQLTDQCFRSSDPRRVADQICFLIKRYGVPRYLGWFKKGALYLFKGFGAIFPHVFVPLTKAFLHWETARLILPGEEGPLLLHLARRKKEGVQVNLNRLGEAILGEQEAKKRLDLYSADLKNPAIDYISVKISTLYSQINLLAWDATLAVLADRFRTLLRTGGPGKFVNLDMEEYKDLALTVALFKKVLSEPEFSGYSAGIVLQAYLPESFVIQQELSAWAKTRQAPIKIRLVKGANLAMERLEASLKGWPQAPFTKKSEVDANFIQMVTFALKKENCQAVAVGIGSHNLFDIAYAMVLSEREGTTSFVTYEMLEGMAEPLCKEIQKHAHALLLYCPAAKREEFHNAIAYLVRRLDENTTPENFLSHIFDLKVGGPVWREEALKFEKSCLDTVDGTPRRTVSQEELSPSIFRNEPDTDLTLAPQRAWATQIFNTWREKKVTLAATTPLETALEIVEKVSPSFAAWPVSKRASLLRAVASELRRRRGDLIGVMMANTYKIFSEADSEVSESIDFANYYASNIEQLAELPISFKGKGATLILPPWNFPCSIPAGGILAALAAGCPVIFKPAPEAALVGSLLVEIFWQAGVPRDFLQFVLCPDEPEGSRLVSDPRIKATILTGASQTARYLTSLQSGFNLIAETGGKNSIIVSNMADRDLAVKDIVQSAFSHAGQKCSACSLVIALEEVYNDPLFKKQLTDAATSLKVGLPWDPAVKVNPLIGPPSPQLKRALTQLEPGESWALMPMADPTHPHLYTPGIKWGVQPGSFTHVTEFFGPLLGVMCAENLQEALKLANGTPYGLTAGLHSLDVREIDLWVKEIEAGNLYVNRGITGAIVQRQPFGGMRDSQFGMGAKAGGPNYVLQLLDKNQVTSKLAPIKDSYAYYWETHFSQKWDPTQVLGQKNLFYYVPHPKVYLRVVAGDKEEDVRRVKKACQICHTPLDISYASQESDEAFIARLGPRPRVRLLSWPTEPLQKGLKHLLANVHLAPVVACGRIELLHYLREVSLSYDYHRYGHIPSLQWEDPCNSGN